MEPLSLNERQEIGQEILRQIGGKGRIAVMTGAKNFLLTERGISFRLPRYAHKGWVNYVAIDLDPSDTYTIRTCRISGADVREMSNDSGVYCDSLLCVLEEKTGLRFSL